MLNPDKYVRLENSLLGQATALLAQASDDQSMSELWALTRSTRAGLSYDRFVLCLDFLHALGVLDVTNGKVEWSVK